MKVHNFEELAIYQKARELAKQCYEITRQSDFKFDTRFVQQLHASSGSVMDNIAEGFERQGNKEFINFLYIAKGSCGEVRSQITRAHDVGFISDVVFDQMFNDCKKLSSSILRMIQTLKSSDINGSRYNPLNSSNENPSNFSNSLNHSNFSNSLNHSNI